MGAAKLEAMRAAFVAAASAALLLGAFAYGERSLLRRCLQPPLDFEVAGQPFPEGASLDAWLSQADARLRGTSLYLDAGPGLIEVGSGEFGLSLDAEATLREARQIRGAEGFLARLGRALGGPPLELHQVPARLRFDIERARARLTALAPSLARAPVDARLDVTHHARITEADGRALDVEATLAAIAHAELGPNAVLPLVYAWRAPKVRLDTLPPVDVSTELSSYETSFKGHAGARAVNIRRAAALLDGALILPGGSFSFNRRVGPRVVERGFVEAPVLVNDETESGPGGGVCQVATTLHAAAVLGGLRVRERRSHSRPSGYAPLGLDATVIDGKVDLRFENPFAAELLVHAYLPTPTSIRVEILGQAPVGHVEHLYQVTERHPYVRRVVESTTLPRGEFERKQKGSFGYDVTSLIKLSRADGSVETHRYRSKYYPVPEVIRVGPGTDLTVLPPLPAGASGLEVLDGERL
jgi:vancomycin resistance protein YoaR